MDHVAFVTIIAKNYTAYALALMKSCALRHPNAALYVVVVDALSDAAHIKLSADRIARTISPLDFLPYEYAMGFAYSYDVTELSTALKPFALRHLLNLGHQRVVYLDPDVLVLHSLDIDVFKPLESASIVLTPHTLEPIPLDGHYPSEITLLLAGAYNLGFIGIRDCEETRRFLSWWADRLEHFCINDVGHGLFVDQKWIDLVPSLFPGTTILRHRGLNVAYWNLHARRLVPGGDVPMLASGEPVIFFHFSGFDFGDPSALSRHQDRIDVRASPALAQLLSNYSAALSLLGHEQRRREPYGYQRLSDGTEVNHVVRALCREARDQGLIFPDPHDVDAEPSLLDYCNASDESDPRGMPRLTRYLARLHASRPDLQAHYPDPRGEHRDAFIAWAYHDPHNAADRVFAEAAFRPPVDRSRGGPVINVAGYFKTESGVGEAGRAHVAAIRSAGCAVHLIDFSGGAGYSRQREAVTGGKAHMGNVNLVCVNADQVPGFTSTAGEGFFRNRFTIGSWYWELPTFPRTWLDRFEPFDEIWVGSEYVRSAIGAASPIPVVRVPPIVAPPPIRDPSKERFGFPVDGFVFLYFFDYLSIFERKNPLGAVRAFRRAFAGRDDVRLVIKTINAEHDCVNAARLAQECAGDTRIEIRESYLSRDEKNAMIAAADCYLSLHRAEGFGLTIAEAMYYGTPVVCTGWSGNLDFTKEANSYIVSAPLIVLDRDFGPYKLGQQWADPDLENAAAAMQRVVGDRVDARHRANRASAHIREHYSAAVVGGIVRERLERIFDNLKETLC